MLDNNGRWEGAGRGQARNLIDTYLQNDRSLRDDSVIINYKRDLGFRAIKRFLVKWWLEYIL